MIEASVGAEHGAQIDNLYLDNFKGLKDGNSNDSNSD